VVVVMSIVLGVIDTAEGDWHRDTIGGIGGLTPRLVTEMGN